MNTEQTLNLIKAPWHHDKKLSLHQRELVYGAHGYVVSVGSAYKHTTEERDAMARVIAAAPCLLKALEAFLAWHDAKPFDEQDVDIMEMAQDAIRKANGED